MPGTLNSFGQPVGQPIADWTPPLVPGRTVLDGKHCRLEPLDLARHADDLYSSYSRNGDNRMWTYLGYGPFERLEDYRSWVREYCRRDDTITFAIVSQPVGRAVGVCAYLRIAPESGSIEVGHLAYSPPLQRTRAATEAMFLMMRNAFQLGYRRYEWKCDALNEPSRRAALRLGFRFEGIFRQASVVKGRNRDTAWYSIIDTEWPTLASAFTLWLADSNFDAAGTQKSRLSDIVSVFRTPN
jgi:RimJ/RimL family protein N-acetyltransferase